MPNFVMLSADVQQKNVQWVENNLTNICIFGMDIQTDIRILPHGTMLTALIQLLIQMLADVRWVGFLPPKNVAWTEIKFYALHNQTGVYQKVFSRQVFNFKLGCFVTQHLLQDIHDSPLQWPVF